MRTLLAALGLALTFASSAHAWVHAGAPYTIGDSHLYSSGAYGAFNAPFRAGVLNRGPDYWDMTNITPSTFPNGTVLHSQWPNNTTGCSNNVCGFMEVIYGDYDFTTSSNPITAKQISAINTLTQSVTQSFGGTTVAGYDFITDIFTTLNPNDNSGNLHELEVFQHCPAFCLSFFSGATQVGTYTDGQGNVWSIAHSGADNLALLQSHADFTSGSIDIKGIFGYLVSQGLMANTEYFNGLAVGIEPKYLGGIVTETSLSFSYS